MGIILDDQQYFTMLVDGYELPITSADFKSIQINEHALTHLPSIRVESYRDRGGVFISEKTMNDGTLITVMMGRTQKEAELRAISFRLTDPPKKEEGNSSSVYTFYGVLDNFKYLKGQAGNSYTGTSSTVLSNIASEVGLSIEYDQTNDNMVWMSGRMPYSKFTRHLSNHGYVNDLSCMINCVSTKNGGTLLYRNMNQLTEKSIRPLKRFYHSSPLESQSKETQVLILSSKVTSKAGLANMQYGYNHRQVIPQLDGTMKEISSVNALRSISNTFEMNSEIKSSLSNMRQSYVPLDCGNIHSNFNQAKYQNVRLRGLFSTNMKLIVGKATNAELLDVVSVELLDAATRTVDDTRTANYIVTAKTREIKGTKYREALLLTTAGKNAEKSPNNINELT